MEIDPADIRFTQDSISLYFKSPHQHFSIREAVKRISRLEMSADDFPHIRVISYGGCQWSVDNRRLWVFRFARCPSVTVRSETSMHPRLQELLSNPRLWDAMKDADFFPRVRHKGETDRAFDRLFPRPSSVKRIPQARFVGLTPEVPRLLNSLEWSDHEGSRKLPINHNSKGGRDSAEVVVQVIDDDFPPLPLRETCFQKPKLWSFQWPGAPVERPALRSFGQCPETNDKWPQLVSFEWRKTPLHGPQLRDVHKPELHSDLQPRNGSLTKPPVHKVQDHEIHEHEIHEHETETDTEKMFPTGSDESMQDHTNGEDKYEEGMPLLPALSLVQDRHANLDEVKHEKETPLIPPIALAEERAKDFEQSGRETSPPRPVHDVQDGAEDIDNSSGSAMLSIPQAAVQHVRDDAKKEGHSGNASPPQSPIHYHILLEDVNGKDVDKRVMPTSPKLPEKGEDKPADAKCPYASTELVQTLKDEQKSDHDNYSKPSKSRAGVFSRIGGAISRAARKTMLKCWNAKCY